MSRRVIYIEIVYNPERALHRAESLAITIQDTGRLFGEVDTAAPGKAASPVMRVSHVFARV